MSTEIEKIIFNLKVRCYPLNLLSEKRLVEAASALRVFELRKGESITMRGERANDYMYVIKGKVEAGPDSDEGKTSTLDDLHTNPMIFTPQSQAFNITAVTDSTICIADSETLDYLLFWDEAGAAASAEDVETGMRMKKVRNSLVFKRLPAEAVDSAFRSMRQVGVKKGDEIIRQGDSGDVFYVIVAGEAEVWQQDMPGEEPECVATLEEGDALGEESLLTDSPRNATVKMITDGSLLAMDRAQFLELVSRPMVREVNANIAKAMKDNGYKLLDVRYEEENEEIHIPESILIPLHELRSRASELDSNERYVVYCRSGKRSKVASLLLTQRNLDAVSMSGGIIGWPFEVNRMGQLVESNNV